MAAKLDSLAIEAFCWPTEDGAKLLKALENMADLEFEKHSVDGQHGEKIVIFSAATKKQAEIRKVMESVRGLANALGIGEDGRLFMSLDKQALFQGKVSKGRGVKISMKFVSFPFNIGKIREYAREIL